MVVMVAIIRLLRILRSEVNRICQQAENTSGFWPTFSVLWALFRFFVTSIIMNLSGHRTSSLFAVYTSCDVLPVIYICLRASTDVLVDFCCIVVAVKFSEYGDVLMQQ